MTRARSPSPARSPLFASIPVAAFVLAAGCTTPQQPAEAKAAPAPEAAADDEVDSPVLSEREAEERAFAYDPSDARDPFHSIFANLAPADPAGEERTALQRLQLDELKLVAVVTGTATPMAMVQQSSGRGHTVKIGTLVGKSGQVVRIQPGRVVVQERYRDYTGRVITVDRSLTLEKPHPELAQR